MTQSSLHNLLPDVREYLSQARLPPRLAWQAGKRFDVVPLAQGEYNMNYIVRQGRLTAVLRVNMGTQIERDD